MEKLQSIQWKRLLVEAAAIVSSILLAFLIDAWWDRRQQHEQDLVHLQAVLDELMQNQALLVEAIQSHQDTVEAGAGLLAIISAKASNDDSALTIDLIRKMMSFYQINAPVGGLNTAIGSGALARMHDRALALSLANWSVELDDLLEEQNAGHDQLLDKFIPALSEKLPMASVYDAKINTTTIQGTREVAPLVEVTVPTSPFPVDFSELHEDFEIENQIMMMMIMARVSEGEALKFSGNMATITASLQQCLDERRC